MDSAEEGVISMALPESNFTKKSTTSADKLAKDIVDGQQRLFGKKAFKVSKKKKKKG